MFNLEARNAYFKAVANRKAIPNLADPEDKWPLAAWDFSLKVIKDDIERAVKYGKKSTVLTYRGNQKIVELNLPFEGWVYGISKRLKKLSYQVTHHRGLYVDESGRTLENVLVADWSDVYVGTCGSCGNDDCDNSWSGDHRICTYLEAQYAM